MGDAVSIATTWSCSTTSERGSERRLMGSTETSPRDYVDAVCVGARAAARDLSALDDQAGAR
jgi:hypothetical protein